MRGVIHIDCPYRNIRTHHFFPTIVTLEPCRSEPDASSARVDGQSRSSRFRKDERDGTMISDAGFWN